MKSAEISSYKDTVQFRTYTNKEIFSSVFFLHGTSDMEPGVLGRLLCRPTIINVESEWRTTPRLEVRSFLQIFYFVY